MTITYPYPSSALYPGATLLPGPHTDAPDPPGGAVEPWHTRLSATLGDLELGVVDDTGTTYVLENVGGWGSPGATLELTQKTRAHGAWRGPSYLTPRTITLDGTCHARTTADAIAARDALIAAATLTDTILAVYEDTTIRYAMVSRQGEVLTPWINDEATAFAFSLQLVASDPRKFGAAVTASTGLPFSSGGLVVPYTVPFTIDSDIVSGEVHLDNPGNIAGPVWIRINGPITGPIITHIGSGAALRFAASLTLAAGEYVDIDMEAQTVLAQGQASRSAFVTDRGWSYFEPGPNTWVTAAVASDPGALITVAAAPAWQ